MDQEDRDPLDEPRSIEPLPPDFYVTERSLAERTGTSARMWQALRQQGKGPPYVRLSSRCIRYQWGAVQEWLANRTLTRT